MADGLGHVYVVGWTEGVLPGQVGGGIPGRRDAFLSKYDKDGNEVWTRQFEAVGNDQGIDVALDAEGNPLVAGYTAFALPGQIWLGSTDAFVRKYDPEGNEIWTRQFGSSAGDFAVAVAGAADGAIYVGGETDGALPGQISSGSRDAFLRKYDGAGNELWTRLKPNRWALTDADFDFDTVFKGKGKGPGRSYTTTDTAGCSCEQIIAVQALGAGHTKHGCSISTMDDWVALVNSL